MLRIVVLFSTASLAKAVLAVQKACENYIATECGEEVNSSQQVQLTNPDDSIKDELRRQLASTSLKEYYKSNQDQQSCEHMYMEMKADAERALTVMKRWVSQAASLTRGKPICAPMKGVERACEKITQDYDHSWQLTDLIRCSIVYTSPEALCEGAEMLKRVQLQGSFLNDLDCQFKGGCSGVVILKNRFAKPFDGYADILTNILIQNEGIGWQVAELQLHLAPVIVAKDPAMAHLFSSDSNRLVAKLKQLWSQSHPGEPFHGGHHYYEVNRSSTDEGERQAAREAENSLYSSALVIAGCTNLAGGNVQAQIANSPKCQCLPKINTKTFNVDLKVLKQLVK